MLINLKEVIEIEEVSELYLTGIDDVSNYKLEWTFSKEALVGFAINLIWLYEEIEDPDWNFHFHTDPLGGDNSGMSVVGIFLTNKSHSLVVQLNGIK